MGGSNNEKTDELISFNLLVDNELTNANKSQTHHALLQVKTKVRDTTAKRLPVELALVLDRSGSMQTANRIGNAKEALKNVVRKLRPGIDKVHVIVYGSNAEVIFANGDLNNVSGLCTQIDNIGTAGCTNMSVGMETAFQLLQNNHSAPVKKRSLFGRRKKSKSSRSSSSSEESSEGDEVVKRIFLFSDGHVNEGVQNHAALMKMAAGYDAKGVSVSTFGVGSGFDEDLMTGLSEHGNGNFFFIDDGCVERMPEIVDAALKGLLGVVGRKASLSIVPMPGVKIDKLFGDENDTERSVNLRDLKENNTKNVLVRYTVSAAKTGVESLDAIEVTWTYEDMDGDTQMARRTARHTYSGSAKKCDKCTNDEVAVAIAVQKAADIDEEVSAALKRNDVARAKQLKEEEVNMYGAIMMQDTTGRVQHLQSKAQAYGKILEAEGNTARTQKWASAGRKMKRRDSICYTMAS